MKSNRVVHPMVVSLYPILAIVAANLDQVRLLEVLRPLLLSMILGGGIWLVSRMLIGEPLRAGILSSIGIALLFSYGHVYNLIEDFNLLGVNIGRHRYLIMLWLTLVVIAVWLTARYRESLPSVNSWLNIVAMISIAIPLVQVLLDFSYFLHPAEPAVLSEDGVVDLAGLQDLDSQLVTEDLPDIYYIIPDMYTSEWILNSRFDFDNSEFTTWLEENGFYVADCSQSNYRRTVWSLSSTLNLDYLEEVDDGIVETSKDPYAFTPYVKNNTVKIITIQTGDISRKPPFFQSFDHLM